MEKYKRLEKIDDITFKRIVGVKRATYNVMVEEYKKAEEERKKGIK
jgi:hypothetical protein